MGTITLDISTLLPLPGKKGVLAGIRRMLSVALAGGEATALREEKFAAILKHHGNIISSVCFAYSNDAEELKDLRQDILLNIWKGLPRYRGDAQLTTWLYRVALNTCVCTIRKRGRRLPTVGLEGVDLTDDENGNDRAERIASLHHIISTLPPLDKAVITMWLDERKYEEIAEVTGLSRGNVAVRLSRIKEKIRDFMIG
ncbi:MAG: sigma-70 family RNA polymerase sigma factor [Bacteroides sp.]|nr:sigma-70 family RNA polymerase sigma factor [Bacteroides sp.]